jgi:hypothetical protein
MIKKKPQERNKLNKILIYQSPWAENDTSFESRYHFILRDIKPIIKNMYGSNHKIEVVTLMPENPKRLKHNDFPEDYIRPIFMKKNEYSEIFKDGVEYLPVLNGKITKKKKAKMMDFFTEKLGDFVPDVIFAINPCPFFKELFPKALYQFFEAGMFSRPPYPYTQYIDTESTLQDVFPVKFKKELNKLKNTPEQQEFVDKIRDKYTGLYRKAEILSREDFDPEEKYKKIILVPLQFSNTFAFDHCCKYKNQEEFLLDVLKNTSKSTLVIATKHKLTEIDDQHVKKVICKKYPNLFYVDGVSPFKGKELNQELSKTMDFLFLSQAILPIVDAVVTVSSSLGLQALLWKIPCICIGNSYVKGFTNYYKLSDITKVENGSIRFFDKDVLLYHLLTHYYIPFSYLWHKKDWPYKYFSEKLKTFRKNKGEIDMSFYTRIDEDDELLKTYLTHRNTTFIFENNPIIENRKAREKNHIAETLPQGVKQEDITIIVRGPVIWPNTDGYESGGTKAILDEARKVFPNSKIILSTWKNEKVANLDYDTIILNDDPGAYKFVLDPKYNRQSNLNRMITSTKEAFKQVDTKYTLVLRTDIGIESNNFLEHWQQYQERSNKFKVFDERVLILSYFTRFSKMSDVLYMYHPSDMIMFGLSDDLRKLWDVELVKFKERFYQLLTSENSLHRPESDFYPGNLKRFIRSFNYKPERIPQYASEQYIWVKCLNKHSRQKPKIQDFYDVIDYDNSDLSIVNNYTVLSPEQFGARIYKKALLHPCHSYHVMTHVEWQKLYKRYCDDLFKPESIDRQRIELTMKYDNPTRNSVRRLFNKVKNHKLYRKARKLIRTPDDFFADMRAYRLYKKLVLSPYRFFDDSHYSYLRPLRKLFNDPNKPIKQQQQHKQIQAQASAQAAQKPKQIITDLPPHLQFEQAQQYLPLPNTGMEANPRKIYDIASRGLRDYDLREKLADGVAGVINENTRRLGLKDFPEKGIYKPYADTLKNEGWVQLPNVLTPQEVDDINNYVKGKPIVDFYNDHKVFDINNIPPETNIGRYTPEFNVNCPHIFKALNHPSVLSVAEQYLGAKPTISVVMLMWSFLNNNPARNMQKFHRDNDDYRFCKVFVLLNDVDGVEDGPHLYVKNTHSQREVWERINKLDMPMKDKKEKMEAVFAGWPKNRYPDELVEEIFPKEDFKYHTGPKGTTIMENTWGIHRGIPPKRKHRFILQAQYSLQPTPMFSYNPVLVPHMKNAPKDIKYVNRMYCL